MNRGMGSKTPMTSLLGSWRNEKWPFYTTVVDKTLYSVWTSQIGLLEMFLINNSLLLNIAKYFCKLLSVLLFSLVHCRSIQHYGMKPESSRN